VRACRKTHRKPTLTPMLAVCLCSLLSFVPCEALHVHPWEVTRVQISVCKCLVLFPQCLGQLRDCRPTEQAIPRGLLKGFLYISRGQPPGIHLDGQSLQYIAVAAQQTHQLRTIGPRPIPHLRCLPRDSAFGGSHAGWFVSIPIALVLLQTLICTCDLAHGAYSALAPGSRSPPVPEVPVPAAYRH